MPTRIDAPMSVRRGAVSRAISGKSRAPTIIAMR